MSGRFQFSIRLLLVATAAVAGVVAALRAKPSWHSFLALEFLNMLFATGAIGAVRKTRGKTQTFWTGVAVGSIVAMVSAGTTFVDYIPNRGSLAIDDLMRYSEDAAGTQRLVLPLVWCGSVLTGAAASVVHWIFSPGASRGAT